MAIWKNISNKSNASNDKSRSKASKSRIQGTLVFFSTARHHDTMSRSVSSKHRMMSPPQSSLTGSWKNIGSSLSPSPKKKGWQCMQINKGGKSKSGRNTNSTKFDGKCNHCNKRGHKEDQCWTKHPELKPEKSRRDERNERPKFALMATTSSAAVPKRQSGPHIWFTDSGASDHFSPHRDLLETFHKLEKPICIETAEGTAIGTGIRTITITVLGENDIETDLELKDVIYAPSMSSNLCSLAAA